jgi:hypothetical protein
MASSSPPPSPQPATPEPSPPSFAGADAIALRRATNSLRCLPFRRAFYEEVSEQPISSGELCRREDWARLVFAPFGTERAEAHFRWLIRLGVLRREVDGQGLTERVRLTPMGREVLARWPGEIPRAGLRERIHENFRRHRPRF